MKEIKQRSFEVVTLRDIFKIALVFGSWTALTFVFHRIVKHETFLTHSTHALSVQKEIIL